MSNKGPKGLSISLETLTHKNPVMSGMSNICDRFEIGGGQRLLKEELESEKIKKFLLKLNPR